MSRGVLDPVALAARRRRTDSPLGRRNPTVKLAVLFAVSVAVLFVLDPVTPAVLYGIAFIAVAASSRLPLRTLVGVQFPFLGFAIGVFSVNALSRPGVVLWQEGVLRVTAEGVETGAALAVRTLLIGMLSMAFILSTDPVAMMTSLHQHARLGIRVACALLAGLRILQLLGREWQAVRQAQLVRARLGRRGRPVLGVRGMGAAAFALLVSSVRRGERIALALEQRGVGLTPRTVWRPVPLAAADAVFAVSVCLVVAAVLIAAGVSGVLAGPAHLF